MNLKLNNRFKSIAGLLLLVSLFFAMPSMAAQSDSTVVDTTVAVVTTAAVDSSAVVSDTAASATIADAATTVTTDTAKVEEVSTIDPQVYKNFFYYVLLFLVICTVIAVIGKIHSVYVLTRKMNGKYNVLSNNNWQAILLLVFLVVFLAGVYYSYAVWGAWAWSEAATEHGKDIDTMFIITLIITTAVLILTHIVLLVFTYIYRAKAKSQAYYYPHNDAIERIWTIVPAIVLTVLVLFGFFTWRSITNVPEELQKSAIQIEVMGEQFAWHVRYPGVDGVLGKRNYKLTTPTNPNGIDFSDKYSWDDLQGEFIVIPVNKSVRFHIISKDIIHSFYIPDFRVQINAVPGMTNYFQFTPTITTEEMRDRLNDPNFDFIMLCNKICGSGHWNMGKKVVVVTEAEYLEWLTTQNKYFTEDLQKEFATKDKVEAPKTASLN
ncbi:cytochrome c oxidase subunit II [Sphingobacterium rhinopitheci]|uniref:cytochrome c oxidase subunit II n=1 Tax=Sphingobacterium rhinopitheci TaxID=2781960 RepID=UPI001F5180A2|nr:cytochrome c oxidase subunit II [Sphingobacterium rhinopitheci]MCI0920873.1 cytochrome c oxidase subunit II [Sphingobacterium rhinopitheci]